ARLIYMSGSFGEVGVSHQAGRLACPFSEAQAWAGNWDRKSTIDRGISGRSSPNGCERLRLGGRNALRLPPLMAYSSSSLQPEVRQQSVPRLACSLRKYSDVA
ncbi:MAG: hypothetical protein ABSH52_21070, partial [Terriglobia bacterium]